MMWCYGDGGGSSGENEKWIIGIPTANVVIEVYGE